MVKPPPPPEGARRARPGTRPARRRQRPAQAPKIGGRAENWPARFDPHSDCRCLTTVCPLFDHYLTGRCVVIEDSLVGLRAAKVPLPSLKGVVKKLVKGLVKKLAKKRAKKR